MTYVAALCSLLLALAASSGPVIAESPATPSPDALYRGAIAHLLALPQQPYLAYVMTQTSSTHGAINFTIAQAVIERRADRVSWNRFVGGDAPSGGILIGRHYLVPDAFIPYENVALPDGALPLLERPVPAASAAPSPLRTIATIRSAISYRVREEGVDRIPGCGDAVHLVLDALREPDRYNVRELWVRASDFRICKAVFESRFFREASQPPSPYPMRVEVVLDSRGLITDAVTHTHVLTIDGPLDILGVVKFTDVMWARDEPAYLFSRAAWEQHQHAPR